MSFQNSRWPKFVVGLISKIVEGKTGFIRSFLNINTCYLLSLIS